MDDFAPHFGNVGIQLAHELQCHILEGKGWPVEQFQYIQGIIHFVQWRHFRRTEIAVAGVDHFL
ncbi:hypothetical protein D3C76_1690510 [compost metagenome]